jgi:uncharacterized protein
MAEPDRTSLEPGLALAQASSESPVSDRLKYASASPWPRDQHLFGPGPKRILAIEGGGIRAAIAVAFLERIEAIVSEQQKRNVLLGDWFDFIGGSSVSGIVACATALGYSAVEVKKLFYGMGMDIFRRSLLTFLTGQARSRAKAVQRKIEGFVGERSLGSRDVMTGLCIVMKRLDTGSPWIIANNPRAPYWEDRGQEYVGNKNLRLADLVRGSLGTPQMLGLETVPLGWKGGLPGLFVDGGLSLYSNPSYAMLLMAVLDAYKLKWPIGPKNLTIVSIGTGRFRYRISYSDAQRVRSRMLATYLAHSLVEEGEALTLSQMQLLGECPAPWSINSDIRTLSGEHTFGGPFFRFLHYDVRLEAAWLSENLDVKLAEREVARLRSSDDPSIIAEVYELGRIAAGRQVKIEHLM